MADDKPVVDNPWRNVLRQAQSGQIVVDEGAARKAAEYAADAVFSLNRTLQSIYLVKYHAVSNNGFLESAKLLEQRLNKQGGRLEEIIPKYIALLNDMGEAFIIAGKLYNKAEQTSGQAFDALKKSAKDRDNTPEIPNAGTTPVPKWSAENADQAFDGKFGFGDLDPNTKGDQYKYNFGDLSKLAKGKGDHYKDPIPTEDPLGKDGKWFVDVGQDISTSKLADRGADWLNFAESIDTDFKNLVIRLQSMTEGEPPMWRGQGAGSAIAAAQKFEVQALDLTQDMRIIGSNVMYIAGCLDIVKGMMPEQWYESIRGTNRELDYIRNGTAGFRGWYIPMMNNASTAIPILGDPTVQKPQIPGPNQTGGTQNQTGGGTQSPSSPARPQQPGMPDSKKPDTPQTPPNPTDPKNNDPRNPDQQKPNQQNPNQQNPNQQDSNQSSQGLQGLQSALQQGLSSAEQAAQALQTQQSDALKTAGANLMPAGLSDLAKELKGGGSKGGGGGGGGGGGPKVPTANLSQARLFPRADVGVEAASAIRAGVAPGGGMPMGGMPMGGMPMGGMGGGAAGQGGKEHKRPEYLDSTEYLEDAIGDPPIVAKPVVEG